MPHLPCHTERHIPNVTKPKPLERPDGSVATSTSETSLAEPANVRKNSARSSCVVPNDRFCTIMRVALLWERHSGEQMEAPPAR